MLNYFANAPLEPLSLYESIPTEMPREKKKNLGVILSIIGSLVALAACAMVLFTITRSITTYSPSTTPVIVQESPVIPGSTNQTVALATDTSVPFITQTATSTSGTQAGEIRINPQDQAEIIYIPAATFDMGLSNAQSNILASKWNTKPILLEQSQPQHSVSLGAFWIYRTEVSNDMYRQCVKAGRCIAPLQGNSATRSSYYDNENFSNYPVVYVSWQMSQMYCEWAGGSLPTEAQWEYAARGPDGYLYPWGNSSWSSALANVENSNIGDTSPVDAYSAGASSFGVLNMSGNVFEWVFDWYRKDYYKTNTNWSNPMGPENGDIYQGEQLKSIRGGSFYNPIGNSSVGIHDWERGNSSWYNVGFRCAVAYP